MPGVLILALLPECETQFLAQRVIMNIIRRQLKLSTAISSRLNLTGIWPPIPTPFDQNETSIDYGVLESNMARWSECGFRGITVQGSNGSYPYLSNEERVELVSSLRKMIDASKR